LRNGLVWIPATITNHSYIFHAFPHFQRENTRTHLKSGHYWYFPHPFKFIVFHQLTMWVTGSITK
jgi:hypothetical protein